jgi:hypothetical protein
MQQRMTGGHKQIRLYHFLLILRTANPNRPHVRLTLALLGATFQALRCPLQCPQGHQLWDLRWNLVDLLRLLDQGGHRTLLPAAPTHPRTHLQDGIHKAKVYTDGTICYGCFASTATEQRNTIKALADSNWKKAMDDEYNALVKNRT